MIMTTSNASDLHTFNASDLHTFNASDLHTFNASDLHTFNASDLHTLNTSALHTLNDEMARVMTPVIVIISINLILGLLGNPLVLLYYGCHGKPTPSYSFIVAMAIFNILICCMSMPMEIVDMLYMYEFPDGNVCKFFRFVNYFASFSSGGVLTAIAVDRYRKVCQPFKKQITAKMSKNMIAVSSTISFCLACPALAFYDLVPIETKVPGIVGLDCTTIRNSVYKMYITVFNGVCFLVLMMCMCTLIVLYILIGRKLVLLKKFQARASVSQTDVITPTASSSETKSQTLFTRIRTLELANTRPNTYIPITEKSKTTPNVNIDNNSSMAHDNEAGRDENIDLEADGTSLVESKSESKNETNDKIRSSTEEQKSKLTLRVSRSIKYAATGTKEKKINKHYIHLRRYTLLMFSVTAAFIISFVPHLGIQTWRTLVGKHEGTILSNSELVISNICIRSWLLGSAVNPFIYGFFNTNFRLYVIAVIKRGLCCCFSQYKCTDIWHPGSKSRQETSHNT